MQVFLCFLLNMIDGVYMEKLSVQYHGTSTDLCIFLRNLPDKYTVLGINIFPEFRFTNITKELTHLSVKGFDLISITRSTDFNYENYSDFSSKQDNNMCIEVGLETSEMLVESRMMVWAYDKIDVEWKRIITMYKKQLNKGAWIVTPDGKRKYLKNHLYTSDAKATYELGVKICPLVGWNHYELNNL